MKKLGAVALAALVSAASANPAGAGSEGAGAPFEYAGTLLVQLAVRDLDRAIAFYCDVLGFRLEERNDALQWARIDPDMEGVTLGLGVQPDPGGSGSVSLNFGVADVEAARAALEAKGVRFTGPTRTVPGVVRLADFEDPDGNRIRLADHPDPE